MSDPFIGEIKMFGGNFAPSGYASCDGQLLSIASNSALFSILGTTYGGDGMTTFGLPDLRGRVPVHEGTGTGLSPVALGSNGGSETQVFATSNLPAHTHTTTAKLRGTTQTGPSGSPSGSVPAREGEGVATLYSRAETNVDMGSTALSIPSTTGSVGGSQSFNSRSPYTAISFIIALTGIFPS